MKPILKWAGGKTQILDIIEKNIPNIIQNYREFFVGGGAVLFLILTLQRNNKIQINGNIEAYDINNSLVNMYIHIRDHTDKLYISIQKIIQEHNAISSLCLKENRNLKPKNKKEALTSKESHYYWIRKKYNNLVNKKKNTIQSNIKISAMFIFLNKTCFRGLYREGPNGFNVPYGNYKNPEIINLEHLFQISELIQNVNFYCKNFEDSMSIENINKFHKIDFIYLDPPYAPEDINSFVKYNKAGFSENTHKLLFNLIHYISEKNIKIMLSNSNTKLVIDNFKQKQYNKFILQAKRSINSKDPSKKTTEIIIKNY